MISKRLKTIASLITEDKIVADVGSDHALLPCYLVLENKIKKAYAIDNKEGPLDSAKTNIKIHDLEDKVFTILQSGIIDLPEDVNCIVLAGMGFVTISEILKDDIKHARRVDQIIIQTNSGLPLMREFLYDQGFVIDDELFLKEADIEYNFIQCHFSDNVDRTDFYVSEHLIKKNDEMYLESLKRRYDDLKTYIQYNDKYLSEYESLKNIFK